MIKNKTRKAFIIGGIVFVILIVLSFFYDPYRASEVSRNIELAKKCDKDALSYLGDFYEKTNDEKRLHEVLTFEKQCAHK